MSEQISMSGKTHKVPTSNADSQKQNNDPKSRKRTSYKTLANKYARQLQIIQEITRIVNLDDKVEVVLSRALGHLLNVLGYRAAQIYRLSPFGEDLWLYLEEGDGSKQLVTTFKDIFSIEENNIISDSARNIKSIYVSDIQEARYSYYIPKGREPKLKSELAVPLCYEDVKQGQSLLGVLRIQSEHLNDFDDIDRSLLTSLASLFASTIKNHHTIQQLHNDLQEIRILYNLQRTDHPNRQLLTDSQGSLKGYHYDGNEFSQTHELPSSAKLAIAKEETRVGITRDDETSSLVAPINLHGETIGVLGIEGVTSDEVWSPDDIKLLEEVSSQVALAIENSRLLQKTEDALAETKKLYQISRALVESEKLEDIFEVVIENAKVFDVDRISISLLDPNLSSRREATKVDTVTIVANWDSNSEQILPVGTQISASSFPLVEAFSHPPFDPLISVDLSKPEGQDERMDEGFRLFMYEKLGAITLFSTPMFLGTEYKGVLSISTRRPHAYTDQEIRVYQTLADQAIIAIENRRLFEAIRQERDQTTLLHQIDRKLGQATTIDQVKETILSFTEKIKASHCEISISDGRNFLSAASTVPTRKNPSMSQVKSLAKALFGASLESEKLKEQETVTKNINQLDEPEIVDEFRSASINSVISTFFYSQRSNLRGCLTFFHVDENGFTHHESLLIESIAAQTLATLENVWLLQQTTIALSETEVLYEATRDFNQARHPDEILDILAKSLMFVPAEVQAELNLDRMLIATISELAPDNTPQKLNVLAQWHQHYVHTGAEVGNILETEISIERYPFISNLKANDSYTIDYSKLDEATEANIDDHFGQARSILAVPLTVGSNWLGILFLTSCSDHFVFEQNLVHRVTTLAGQAAVVIQNLQLIEETQQTLYNSEILSHLSQELLGADTKEVIHELSLDAIASTEPGRGAAIFMYDQAGTNTELELVAIWDNPTQAWPTITPGTRFSTEALGLTPLLKQGQTLVFERVVDDTRLPEPSRALLTSLQIYSLLTVPIWLGKGIRGFILVSNHQAKAFPPDAIRLYEDVARQVSSALENLRLLEEAQHRARLLQTAAEVSQAATSYLDLGNLLSESVDLIKERFGFYHASIFMIDEYQKYAVVKASTGEVGKKMLAMPHKLEVGGRSIVGTATATGKPRIALDVGIDTGHFNNPLLPDTRSEMALPLTARGRVIGALDVQSTMRNAFSDIDITILQSMANQLANAIEAALSFQDSQVALERVQKLNEYYLREQWVTFLKDQQSTTGYRLSKDGLTETREVTRWSEITQALDSKQPVIIPKAISPTNGDRREETKRTPRQRSASQLYVSMTERQEMNEPATLIAPLSLQDEVVIGAVDFELPDQNTTWEEDNLEIIEAVTQQAAQAIEATRLFEQTQAAREEAEALYKVGRALVTAASEQAMFQTVLREMLSTLGLKQGGVLLFDPSTGGKLGKLVTLFEDSKPVETDEYFPIQGNASYERLIATKRPVAIEDVLNDPLVATVRERNIEHNLASLLLVPIIINDEVIGAVGADSVGKKHIFTEWEISLAGAMADQLSIMLQNRRLLDETHRRAVQLQTSADVGRVATSILDEDLMLDNAVKLIKERFGLYHVQIFLVDMRNEFAVLHRSTGRAGQKLLEVHYKVAIGSQSIIGQAGQQRKSLVIRNANPVDLDTPNPQHEFLPDSQAELAIPLQVMSELIGILDVHSNISNAFTADDIATLEVLAAQLAIAIKNARTFRQQQETAERLREIDKLKTQFLANMSHELRTPLNSIIGFSRVILKGIDGPLTELQKTDLTSIHNSGQHLLSLINNILDLSKIEAGKMELNFEEVDIEPIVKSIMSTALALVKDKPVELHQELPESLPSVWADPTRIRQITLNLVSNACKFTDEGAVTLSAFADQRYLTITVSDTGIGISEEQLGTIFEEFTQVDASTTRKVGGTGLGLPISRHFVEMHKGHIWVESTPGKGSTFSFTIPIKPGEEEEIDPVSDLTEKPEEEGQEKVIVAIDDDPGVIKLYERFLKNQGYKVIGINDGKQVISQVKAHTPSAILLDVLIPDQDGWSIIRELKNDPFTQNIPVVICSIVSDKKRGFSLGAADYMTKPITESELIRALKNLDRHEKEQIKVLVIDDQADDILLIRRFLEAQSNYSIIDAKSGKIGLQLVKSQKPDLIILDLTMPNLDGFEVVEALKNNDETRSIPIIIVSAKELTASEEEFLTGQVEALLRKGLFTESELMEDVTRALNQIQPNVTINL